MRESASLAGVPLDAVLGWRFDEADRLSLLDVVRQLEEQRQAGDTQRWTYDDGQQSPHAGATRRQAIGTVLGLVYEQDDWLELSLEFWRDADSSVLVAATVEVACFCATNHNVHYVAEEQWVATTPGELAFRASQAVILLAEWAASDRNPSQWRQLSHLPDR